MRPSLKLIATTPAPKPQAFDPARRGYVIAYRQGQVNHCPGCGRSQWHVGRLSAECAYCCTALPLGPEEAHG